MNESFIPRLATYSHRPDTGVGCVMNLMSFEQGRYVGGVDKYRRARAYDKPEGFIPELQSMLIRINDRGCTRRIREYNDKEQRYVDLLCPQCSMALIDLAHSMMNARIDPGQDALVRAFLARIELYFISYHSECWMQDSALMYLLNEIKSRLILSTETVPVEKTKQAWEEMTAGKVLA